jgi:shikimate kinase
VTADDAVVEAARPVVVLVGPPGSGKSTVGRSLAATLGVDFRDTDDDVEASTGSSIADLFVERGEAFFREQEVEAVAVALGEHTGVLALGAGAILDDRTRKRLSGRTVVHLRVGLAAAMGRLEMNRSRPLLLGNVRGLWQELAAQREPLYQEVATLTVDTDKQTPDEIAQTIVTALADAGRVEDERGRT